MKDYSFSAGEKNRPIPHRAAPARRATGLLVAILLVLLLPWRPAAQDAPPAGPEARPAVPESERLRRVLRSSAARDVDRRVARGLEFLAGRQRPDGSILAPGGRDSYRVALTSLSLMAFVACGLLPGDGAYGGVVEKGLDFLLDPARQDEDGYFGNDATRGSDSRMYGHGITTLLLAELAGMGEDAARDARLLRATRRAVELILAAQNVAKDRRSEGGWRYSPRDSLSDLSITVWQVMALRAAKNAHVEVPDASIDRAVRFILGCFDAGDGGFKYRPAVDEPTTSSVAAGVFSLHVCGHRTGDELRASEDYLLAHPPSAGDAWFYYGVYYYAQAMRQLGSGHDARARDAVHGLLLPLQQEDGSWPEPPTRSEETRIGPIYWTAMVILTLAVEYDLLPIYQR